MAANAAVVGKNMGPLKKGGKGIYAGRWVDPVTGEMRVLPEANMKYVNPFSYEQKLGYL